MFSIPPSFALRRVQPLAQPSGCRSRHQSLQADAPTPQQQDQWKKKKQTKDEARAAKRGKLDPDSELNRNAKEVLEERARNKRKLQEIEAGEDSNSSDGDDDEESDIAGIEKEKPGEGLKRKQKTDVDEESAPKKQKLAEEQTKSEAALSKKQQAKEAKKLAKKLRKEEAKKQKEEKTKKPKSKAAAAEEDDGSEPESEAEKPAAGEAPVQPSTEVDGDVDEDVDDDMAPIDVSGLATKEDEGASAESTSDSAPHSPVFDTEASAKNASAEPASTTTSISSAVPPSEKPKYLKIPTDTTALRARLEAKLAAMRAARKVADADGTPIRTRQDLIEARREKQAQRKAHKKEMRRLQKEEEDRKREEALASARNSPGLSPLLDETGGTNFAFGRLTFADGTELSHDASYEKTPGSAKKKGPSDPKTALLKLEAQKKRIAAMDESKRKEVLEKETWLAARRRAEGQKVHDDESLLKKALKRKEKAKKKSEREWKERAKGVETAIQERQRKREENIRKRREEKLAGRGKKKNKGVATRKKNRPGFEGGFGGGRK